MRSFKCVACSSVMDSDALDPTCDRCGSAVVLLASEVPEVTRSQLDAAAVGVWRYAGLLPQVEAGGVISLGEGGTPLLRAKRLGEEVGLSSLFIKDESRNPTGSFMDRGSTVLLSLAKKRRVKECNCVTTGNLGASLAAYCAKAGVEAHIRVHPEADRGKLYQMLAYGADVESSTVSRPKAAARSVSVTAGNPYLIEGEKTTGFEVMQDLGWRTPDVIVVPVGTGGHLSTIWRAVSLFREMGLVDASECRLVGVQVRGSARPERDRGGGGPPSEAGSLLLAELEESVPYFHREASMAVSKSGGATLSTTPAQIIESTRLLATTEGIFAEPSSASVVAAVKEAVRRGLIGRSETVVCVVTGAGLKDTKAVSRLAREARRVSAAEPYPLPTPKIGATKLALLRLLRDGPSYGYELWLEIGRNRRMSTASVYQHLLELEGFSMVRKRPPVVAKGRERVPYELTKRGADFLRIASRLEAAE